ncbi:MAG: hypothetical protein HYZ75_08580 [Elusimicrobia bacterium]|nr:hypothetical protein [Elusimicrobiota bacterium]
MRHLAALAILLSAASAAQGAPRLGQAELSPLADYEENLRRTVTDTEAGRTRHAPRGTVRSALAVLGELQRRKELPEKPASYGAIPAAMHAGAALQELDAYVDTLGNLAGAGGEDARIASMRLIAARSRELLRKGYTDMNGELDKLVAGHPKVWQVLMRALLIVSGNKTTATLAEEKATELEEALKAMKPGAEAGRPTAGPEVERGDLKPEIPENELRLVAALREDLAEVYAEVAAADLTRGAAELLQAKADDPASEIGRLYADGRSRATTRTMKETRLTGTGLQAKLAGRVKRDDEPLRDAVAATPKEEVASAVGGLEVMHERSGTAARSLTRVTGSGGEIAAALSAIETCSNMALGAVRASNEAVDKDKETNEALEELGGRWDAASAAGDASGMAGAEAEAKAKIAVMKKEHKKAEDSAKGAFMANQRAMKALGRAVAAVTAASRDLGLDERRAAYAAQ